MAYRGNSKTSGRYDGKAGESRAALFDFVVGNTDRHAGNWIVGKNSKGEPKLKLIDHNLTFPDKESFSPRDDNSRFVQDMAREHGKEQVPQKLIDLYVKNREAIDGVLRKVGLPEGAVTGINQRIDSLKPGSTWSNLWAQNFKMDPPEETTGEAERKFRDAKVFWEQRKRAQALRMGKQNAPPPALHEGTKTRELYERLPLHSTV